MHQGPNANLCVPGDPRKLSETHGIACRLREHPPPERLPGPRFPIDVLCKAPRRHSRDTPNEGAVPYVGGDESGLGPGPFINVMVFATRFSRVSWSRNVNLLTINQKEPMNSGMLNQDLITGVYHSSVVLVYVCWCKCACAYEYVRLRVRGVCLKCGLV